MKQIGTSLRCDSIGTQAHNRREDATNFDKHIRTEDSVRNITLIDIDAREFYEKYFTPVINEYNEKQKRADRKIQGTGADYYDKVNNQKYNRATRSGNKTVEQHAYYEMIAQVGNELERIPEDTAVKCLTQYVNEFQKRNHPNLHVIGAYIHLDETTPHLHLDYVPVRESKRGMSKQNGLNGAFEQLMHYETKSPYDTAQMQWQAREREVFRAICKEHGIETKEVKHNDAQHQNQYDYAKQKAQQAERIIADAEKGVRTPKTRQNAIQKLLGSDEVLIKKTELERLKVQADSAKGAKREIVRLERQNAEIKGERDKALSGTHDEQQQLREQREKFKKARAEAINEINEARAQDRERIEQIKRVRSGSAYREKQEELQEISKEISEKKQELRSINAEINLASQKLNKFSRILNEKQPEIDERIMRDFCRKNSKEFKEYKRDWEKWWDRQRDHSR